MAVKLRQAGPSKDPTGEVANGNGPLASGKKTAAKK